MDRDHVVKALHVIAPALHGGAESVVYELAAIAVAAGRPVCVAALIQDASDRSLVHMLRDKGVDVREIRCGRRRYWQEINAVVRLMQEIGADVLHTHVYHADIVGLLAARKAGCPVVATVHGFTGGGPKNRFYTALDLRVLRRFDRLIAVSDPLRDHLIQTGCAAARVDVVPNGGPTAPVLSRLEARRQLGIPEGSPQVGWVGRLSREKGPDLFIDAIARGSASGVMIGDGVERRALAARLDRDGLSDRIQLVGARPRAGELMPAFDAFVVSSRTEGSPIGLLEAVHAGTPVVAFAVGGIPDTLPAEAGWLVTPGDTGALSRAIDAVLRDPAEAAKRVERARVEVERRFGAERWQRDVEAVYRKVIRRT